MKISIVIPAYNEENRLGRLLEQIKKYKETRSIFEVIVVSDGSTDNTIEVARKAYPKVRIIDYKANRGKGYALKQGMLAARGEIVLFMDADASSDIMELERFLPYLRDYDIIVGSRTLKKGFIVKNEGVIRRFIGLLGHKLIGIVITNEIKDLLCAFKVYKKDAKDKIFSKQISEGMASDFEAIFLAKRFGYKIKEIPIKWSHQDGGTAKFSWYTKALKELFMVRLNQWRGKYS